MFQVIMSDTIQGAYCHKGAAFGVHSSQVRKVGTEQEITESVVAQINELEASVDLEGQSFIDPTSNLANRVVVI